MPTLRTFLAIELPEDVRARIAALQTALKESGVSVKWVEKENLHITLRFLGDVDEDRIWFVREACEEVADKLAPVGICLEGLGAFPSSSRPRILWVGVSRGREDIVQLRELLEDRLEKKGFPRKRDGFSAHVTIGRVKEQGPVVVRLRERMSHSNFPSTEVRVTAFAGMKSTLTPTGPVYDRLFEVKLGSPGGVD